MPRPDKNALLADEILKILRKGLTLSTDVVNYIDSTFSNPSLEELINILQDDSNCEKDSLVELLFFPDENMQVHLEEILEDTCFEQEDEEKVLNYMCRKPLTVFYRFPHNRDSFSLEIPGATVHQFIKRLNISKQIDRRLISTIKKNVGETHRRRFTVRIRNSRFQASDSALDFLYAFFEKWNMQASDVMPHFDFILSFLEELQEDTDIYDALMKKKRFYFKHLKRTEQFEERLLKSNMETLMLSGKITSVMDKNEARDKIKIIDQIGLTIFGKTESIDLHADNVESMNLSSNRDLQNVIRRLS